jgi:hypothetical protein
MRSFSFPVKAVSLLMAGCVLLTSCTSTTRIQSIPEGARVYINEEPAGTTPLIYSDTKIMFSSTNIRLEKDGYAPCYSVLTRDEEADVGAIIGGFIFWVPFAWSLKYRPSHTYELYPLLPQASDPALPASKADQLRELKQLLDENVITQEDYDKQKARILDEDYK